jgi:hypothetical protein
MRNIAIILGLFGAIGFAHADAASAQETAVQRAMRRGTMMFWLDRAAWVTSDDLVKRLPASRRPEVGGWVEIPSGTGFHVVYHGRGAAADRAIYAADVRGPVVSNAIVYPADGGPMLAPAELVLARALGNARTAMASHSDWRPCSRAPFNTIVLPPESDGTIPVYFLTPQTESGSFPFGGHYEIDIAADGHTAAERGFTRSCITLTKSPAEPAGKPAAMFLTHLLDPQPTEIHVFMQFGTAVPLFVMAQGSQTLLKVENGLIEKSSLALP